MVSSIKENHYTLPYIHKYNLTLTLQKIKSSRKVSSSLPLTELPGELNLLCLSQHSNSFFHSLLLLALAGAPLMASYILVNHEGAVDGDK